MYRFTRQRHWSTGRVSAGAFSGRLFSGLTGLLVAFGHSHAGASAQEYPVKPIRIVAGSAAGGPIDITARLVAKQLTLSLHQQAVVENRTGAGGTIGAEYVAKSPPDGYTLLMGSAAALCIAPALRKNLRYSPVADFAPITTLVDSFAVLVVHPSVPVRSVKELIAYTKSHDTPLTFGSAGAGSHTHLAMELFKSMSGVKATHVPYKGGAPALLDVVAGHIDMMMIPVVGLGSFAKDGKVRILGSTSRRTAELIRTELPKWAKVVKAAGATAN